MYLLVILSSCDMGSNSTTGNVSSYFCFVHRHVKNSLKEMETSSWLYLIKYMFQLEVNAFTNLVILFISVCQIRGLLIFEQVNTFMVPGWFS